ncbi:MAG: VOC family protein [Rhodobacteraceae bacterium]|nr:VOC family protein [Paracoccaceae bacterium]
MAHGIPGLAGSDHIGFTVPSIEEATRFFVDVVGCVQLFEVGPFEADDDWMKDHLNVHPRAVIKTLRMLKCRNGPAFEIFEYTSPDQRREIPKNSDHGGHHLAFYVENMGAAVAYLKSHGVRFQGDPSQMDEGPSKGLTWVYFLAPWGMQLELVSYPDGLAYEATAKEKMWSPR